MDTNSAIKFLEEQIKNPTEGLPEEIFLFVSRITPLINVDLLIKDEKGRTLLAWRDDPYYGRGWHVPGGIVRFKEKLETRLLKVAQTEIGAEVKFEFIPLAINQAICQQQTRGHFLSILYKGFLGSDYLPKNKELTDQDQGFLKWHDFCPVNFLFSKCRRSIKIIYNNQRFKKEKKCQIQN